MIKQIKIIPEVAHLLTKLSKKEQFFFRTLTRTDKTEYVIAVIDERGLDSMVRHNLLIIEGKLTNGSAILLRIITDLDEGIDVEKVVDKYVACGTPELRKELIEGISRLVAPRQTNY